MRRLLAVCLAAFLSAASSADRFWVKVLPKIGNAPCTLRVTVHAPQEEAAYVLVINGADYATGSVKENPSRTVQFTDFKDLPPNEYEVWTRIFDFRGKEVYGDRQQVICQGAPNAQR